MATIFGVLLNLPTVKSKRIIKQIREIFKILFLWLINIHGQHWIAMHLVHFIPRNKYHCLLEIIIIQLMKTLLPIMTFTFLIKNLLLMMILWLYKYSVGEILYQGGFIPE